MLCVCVCMYVRDTDCVRKCVGEIAHVCVCVRVRACVRVYTNACCMSDAR